MEYLEFIQDGKKITNLEFPETEIGNSSEIKLVIKNPNGWPLMLIGALVDDHDIVFSSMPDVIDAFDSISVEATLTPTLGRGPVNAELKIKVMF